MKMSESIALNRKRTIRFKKADRLLRRMRQRVFDYEDSGQSEQADRIIKRCKRILMPLWEQRYRNNENRRTQNYMM